MPPSLGAYEDLAHLWPFAALYRAFAQAGISSPDVKRMFLWEAGAAFGEGFPDRDDAPVDRDVMAEHAEYLLAVQRGEDPEPPAPDVPRRGPQEALLRALPALGGEDA